MARKNPVEKMLGDMILTHVEGVWTLLYKDHRYMDLIDAHSRDDALSQIAEMMFMKVG
jgi:hypothetical protein